MKLIRLFFVSVLATLLCGATEPKAKTSIVLAKPIKILKYLGPDPYEEIPNDSVYLVKMKTISLVSGDFSGRTFNVRMNAHMPQYIFLNEEYAVVFDLVDGEYHALGAIATEKYFCLSQEDIKKTDIPPESLYRIIGSGEADSDMKCYYIPEQYPKSSTK